MKYEARLRLEVVDDLTQGKAWYESESPGLGDEFIVEYQDCLARITASPELYAAGFKGVRAARFRRFNFVMYYRIVGPVVWILRVVHGGRDDSAWKEQI